MIALINSAVLLLLVLTSVFFDVTKKIIPNYITIPAIFLGFVTCGIVDGINGIKFSIFGLLVGLVIFMIPFMLGGMGGGDVKLIAAIGALKGWEFVIWTTIYSGIAGGAIIIVILLREKSLVGTLNRLSGILIKPIILFLLLFSSSEILYRIYNWISSTEINWEKRYIPYGLAIGIGSFITYFSR